MLYDCQQLLYAEMPPDDAMTPSVAAERAQTRNAAEMPSGDSED